MVAVGSRRPPQLFNFRFRLGVIGHSCGKMVKDCYIIPLSYNEDLHKSLLPLEGPGLAEVREDVLLSLVVRNKRSRPGEIFLVLVLLTA